ncbi:MAG: addiction module protein [Kofleriaceae bacterium]
MTAAVKAMLEQAKRLSAEELAELRAELDTLEDPTWAAAWKSELDRRWTAYESGAAGEPAEDVIAQLKKDLRARP